MGLRYTDALETNSLPFYALTDIVLNKSVMVSSFSFSLQLAVKNVFDREYQIYELYPMPGRSMQFALALEYE
jgi:outer membrane cobalamin receptor